MEDLKSALKDFKNVDKFVDFFEFFVENSKRFNLTSITVQNEIVIKHFEDSLAGLEFIPLNSKVVEIGSGGGFPSVPIKIVNPDIDFTLIEATGKKCDYLNKVKKLLNFDNFEVICGRSEELGRTAKLREAFDVAIARAVAPLNILCEYMLPFLKIGGIAICYKGSNFEEELQNAAFSIKVLGGKTMSVHTYALSQGFGERALIIIKKITKTPDIYPRREAKIRKSPL